MTGPTPAVRQVVMSRNHGICLRCNRAQGEQIHHRRPRGRGGSSLPEANAADNLVFICSSCHSYIESHRTESYRTGWLLRHTNEEPGSVALVDRSGRTFFITDDGGPLPMTDFFPANAANLIPPF